MSEQQLKPDSAMRRASALFARIALAIVVVLLVGGHFAAGTQAYSASTPLFAMLSSRSAAVAGVAFGWS